MADQTVNGGDGNSAAKRKRDSTDSISHDAQRLARGGSGLNTQPESHNYTHQHMGYEGHGLGNTSTELIDQQILQHVGNQNGLADDNALTAKAALAAHAPQGKYAPSDQFGGPGHLGHDLPFTDNIDSGLTDNMQTSTAAAVYAAREAAQNLNNTKPTVGSPEWHNIRKNNHKEVERRRREAINEGINQIAQLVPNCDKNKGAILQRCIEYIVQLQDERKQMDARWEQSNMTTGQAINEISTQNAKLKAEVNRRGDIALKWIQRCRDAGLDFDDYEDDKDLGQLEIDHTQAA